MVSRRIEIFINIFCLPSASLLARTQPLSLSNIQKKIHNNTQCPFWTPESLKIYTFSYDVETLPLLRSQNQDPDYAPFKI